MARQLRRLVCGALLLLAALQFAGAALVHAKAWLGPQLVSAAYLRSERAGGAPVRPWPWADTWPVARLALPELAIERLVLAGDSGNVLAFGPGHSPASVAPGEVGEIVIAGHRDTHFAFLEALSPGQHIVLSSPAGRERRYRVRRTEIHDSRVQRLQRHADVDRLLLITCYPFSGVDAGGPLRWVVVAEPVDAPLPAARRGEWAL